MKLATAFIGLNALMFAFYGLAFVAFPEAMSQLVSGTAPATAAGLADMRATYGGLSLAAAVLLSFLGLRQGGLQLGLMSIAVLLLSMAVGRLTGILVDGAGSVTMYTYLSLEVVIVILALWLWFRLRNNHP